MRDACSRRHDGEIAVQGAEARQRVDFEDEWRPVGAEPDVGAREIHAAQGPVRGERGFGALPQVQARAEAPGPGIVWIHGEPARRVREVGIRDDRVSAVDVLGLVARELLGRSANTPRPRPRRSTSGLGRVSV